MWGEAVTAKWIGRCVGLCGCGVGFLLGLDGGCVGDCKVVGNEVTGRWVGLVGDNGALVDVGLGVGTKVVDGICVDL